VFCRTMVRSLIMACFMALSIEAGSWVRNCPPFWLAIGFGFRSCFSRTVETLPSVQIKRESGNTSSSYQSIVDTLHLPSHRSALPLADHNGRCVILVRSEVAAFLEGARHPYASPRLRSSSES